MLDIYSLSPIAIAITLQDKHCPVRFRHAISIIDIDDFPRCR
jgi:hypothetical protein